LIGPDAPHWLDRLAREHDNLRAVVRWSVDQQVVEPGLRVAGALYMYWYFRSQWSESRSALTELLAQPVAADRRSLRARAFFTAGWLAIDQGQNAEARRLCKESLTIAREIADERCMARALVILGLTHHYHGDNAGARPPLQEALTLGRRVGDQWAVEVALMHLGTAYFLFDADYPAARAAFGENLALARASGNRWVMAHALEWLGNTAFEQGAFEEARGFYDEAMEANRQLGDHLGVAHVQQRMALVMLDGGNVPAARELLIECLRVQREIGDVPYVTMTFEGLAGVAGAQVQSDHVGAEVADRALRVAGFAHVHRKLHNPPLSQRRQARLDAWLAPARQALSREAAATAWEGGLAMDLDQAIDYVLADD
jgi:tetratricopeptide (TPR) repeat protein